MQYEATPINTTVKIISYRFNKWLSKNYDYGHIFISEAVKKNISDHLLIKNGVVIHNAVQKREVSSALAHNYLKKENIEISDFFVVVPGRLHSAKGHHFLIDSLAKYIHLHSSKALKLCFVGGGSLKEELLNIIENQNLGKHIFVTDYVNNTLMLSFLALANLVVIPQIKAGVSMIFSNPNDRSVLAESFRILTTNMKFVLPSDGVGKVIFCTSTIKGEGKTFMSLNLSLAMASLNKKVLLIGADLRNPQLHSYANVNKNQMGLSNYLTDPTLGWESSIMKIFDKHPNHEVLFSGVIPPNPAHLLANGNFETLIEEAKLIYDYIIVDLAPTILVTDTLLVAHLADATICAVRANHTDKKLIPFSVDLSNTKRLVNMSYVINGVKENRSYGYNYNYGYNYGYGDIES
ncbi:polysaccharide biosynthesis tyrosine autokinase [Flavobacteriaceae bacterium]|nr:polysaccharide biosynthesis tyrosine autokinase [Flavobacteriaceae bacterium]